MKKLLIITFIFISITVNATKYYVKSTGNNSNTGLSNAQAWATVSKVNETSLAGGDSVFFNRGDVWREALMSKSGSEGNYLYYGAYGTGNKPKLLGSVTANSGWTNVGTNIWQNSNAAFTVDVGNLIFNNEASCGIKQMAASPTLDTQGDFWYDFVNDRIRMYSVGNPATFYSNIECTLKTIIVTISSKSYVTFENLDLRYGNYAIQGSNSDNIIIRNCDISYIGGGDMDGDYTTRAGNGIEFWDNTHDNLVERCHISNCYDAGVTNQGEGSSKNQYNIYYRNNIIEKCEYSAELWSKTGSSKMTNVHFENNTCVNAGGGWGHNQRPDGANGHHIMVYTNTATVSSVYFRNNIFYNATESLIDFYNGDDVTKYIFDFNDLYQSSGNVGKIVITEYATPVDWRTATSQDMHSVSGNPIFVSASDFHLQAGSPAIGKGLKINSATIDYDGNTFKDPPSIGAYEYYLPELPFYQTSSVENTTPSLLEMTYNLSLANIVPDISAFNVLVNSAVRAVSSVAIAGNKVRLTLISPVIYGDIVTVSYTKSASNPLQTASGGRAASLIAQTATNKVASFTLPTYVSSSIENATPSLLSMTYNMALANLVPAASAFSVHVNSVVRIVNAVTVSGTKVQLTLASPIVYGDVVTFSYTKPASNPLQTTSGGIAASISNQTVNNNCINAAPTVVITSPIMNNSFTALTNITINASASDPDGSVILVEFYNGSTKIGSKATAPYSFTWNNVAAGIYSLTVIATDNTNTKTISSAISISVINGATNVNQPPVVEIYNPLKGNKYETNSTITLEAIASDTDGSISYVEFYSGAIKLVELTSPPYSYTWKDVPPGSYSIIAVAKDNLNATATSLPIEFEVGTTIKYDSNSEIISLYPNPNDGHFSIEFINPLQNGKSEIVITDLAGKQVYNGLLAREETLKQFDLSNSKQGIYIIMIKDKDILVTKKFIKN